MKASKIKVRDYCSYYIDWSNTTLEQIKKDIIELEKLGVTNLEIESDTHINYYLWIEREETNEEFKKRISWEYIKEKILREQELKQLETLRKKYNI